MDENILETILAEKRKEVVLAAAKRPLSSLREEAERLSPCLGFCRRLKDTPAPAIIAEIKRASPSKGLIRPDLDPVKTALAFEGAGAACLSVLTDEKFFQGSLEFLLAVRSAVPSTPLLRKDFICHPYQVWETRVSGADALLLIVAALSDEELELLSKEAQASGLDTLFEVHTIEEMVRLETVLERNHAARASSMIGINNRDLKTFQVDLSVTARIIEWARNARSQSHDAAFVAESGILSSADLLKLQEAGAAAFLLGEYLVRSGEPGENLKSLIQSVRG